MSNGEVKQLGMRTFVRASEHERVVAELKASIEHSETKVGWLLHDNEKNVREHERVVAEKDVAYNNLDDVNMALNEKIAKQAKVIEKLKNMIPHYEECKKLDASDYADDDDIPCDCGIDKEIAAIENLK